MRRMTRHIGLVHTCRIATGGPVVQQRLMILRRPHSVTIDAYQRVVTQTLAPANCCSEGMLCDQRLSAPVWRRASEAAAFLTGANIAINGAQHMQ